MISSTSPTIPCLTSTLTSNGNGSAVMSTTTESAGLNNSGTLSEHLGNIYKVMYQM